MTKISFSLGLVAASVFSLAGASLALADDAAQKALYDKHCKKCHADDGSGKKADGEWLAVAKTLKLEKPDGLSVISAEAKKLTDDDILKSMMEGKGKMKSLKDKMTEADAKSLVTYTRSLQAKAK